MSRRPFFPTMALLCVAFLGACHWPPGLQIPFPPLRLANPTGSYPVATQIRRLTDSTRPEPATADPDDRRSVVMQLWYPTVAVPPLKGTAWLASRGYIVVSVEHPHDTFLTVLPDGTSVAFNSSAAQQLPPSDATPEHAQAFWAEMGSAPAAPPISSPSPWCWDCVAAQASAPCPTPLPRRPKSKPARAIAEKAVN